MIINKIVQRARPDDIKSRQTLIALCSIFARLFFPPFLQFSREFLKEKREGERVREQGEVSHFEGGECLYERLMQVGKIVCLVLVWGVFI